MIGELNRQFPEVRRMSGKWRGRRYQKVREHSMNGKEVGSAGRKFMKKALGE